MSDRSEMRIVMTIEKATAKDFLHFVKYATSPFQVVEESRTLLNEAGFEELDFGQPWSLTPGASYYTVSYGTTLFAFSIGKEFDEGDCIHIASAHTDHPCLRVKPRAEMCDHGYLKLDVEFYGGASIMTWLDRPLSIAGKVTLKSGDIYHPFTRLVDFRRPLLTIPSLAVHMTRDNAKSGDYNKQTEMLPIIGMLSDQLEKDAYFIDLLAKECKVKASDILDFDLYIYNAEEGCLLGMQQELLSAPRLDNLTSCYACLTAITASSVMTEISDRLNLIALFDNEEIGSRTKQGADSMITNLLLQKIYTGLGYDQVRLTDSLFHSMMLSLDVAHAYHPNFPQKNDPNLIVTCGQGPALKLSYSQRYATDTEAIGMIEQLCQANEIPYQKYVNRSDITGGSTLGTILSAYLPIKTVDIGIGILAMHSAREFMGTADQTALNTLVYCFFL